MLDRAELQTYLQQYRHIAVVGLSADPSRPSYGVAQYLQAAGYTIIPINPRHAGQTILGQHTYASLTQAQAAGEQIEIVDVFRKAQDIPPIVVEAIQVGARLLWVQLGIRNDEAARQAQEANLPYVQDRCLKVEHARLFHTPPSRP